MKKAALVIVVLVLVNAATAAAFRPRIASVAFKRATSADKGPVLVLRTKQVTSTTGPAVAFQTQPTFSIATEIRHGRWIVSRKTEGGPRLFSRMQADIREKGKTRVWGGVAANAPPWGRLDYFVITEYGTPAFPQRPPRSEASLVPSGSPRRGG